MSSDYSLVEYPLASPAPASKALSPLVHEVLQSPGRPLDRPAREFLEERFERDFSRVRVHDDSRAAASAHALRSHAYTAGQDLVFGSGRYDPRRPSGLRLLAHELGHTVQHGSGAGPEPRPWTLGESNSASEREADLAADRVLKGGPISLSSAAPGVIRRAEYGTYISKVGEQDYLKGAANYYKLWGAKNINKVNSVEEVLDDLGKSKGTIDRFRIVSHATEAGMMLGLTTALSPEHFGDTETEFTKPLRFRQYFSDLRLVNEAGMNEMLAILQGDAAASKALTDLGVGKTLPQADSALGILLRTLLEQFWVGRLKVDGAADVNFANRGLLNDYNTTRRTNYRQLLVDETAKDQKQSVGNAVDALARAMPGAFRQAEADGKWHALDLPRADADVLADPFTEDVAGRRVIKRDLAAAIKEGAGKGTMLPKLKMARTKITKATHIEIRGCNIGSNPDLMDKIRGFFGDAGEEPSISAPDLYQFFTPIDTQTYNESQAGNDKMQADWNDPATAIAPRYDDWNRIRSGEMIRVAGEKSMADVSRLYNVPEADLKALNPHLRDPANLSTGDLVWLKAGPIPVGNFTKLDEFCENVLGNKYLWPKIWGFNPWLVDPRTLTSKDRLWIVPPDQQKASATRTLADFKKELHSGVAFAQWNTDTSHIMLRVSGTKTAESKGAWLGRQGFDLNGRSAAQLNKMAGSNLYAQFLSQRFMVVEDPILPEDPRYGKHFITRP